MKVVYLYSDNSKDEQPLSDNETRKVPAAPSLIHLIQQTTDRVQVVLHIYRLVLAFSLLILIPFSSHARLHFIIMY